LLFRLESLRFSFVACESIYFPEGKSSNSLRGAFGTIFRRVACLPHCSGPSGCDRRATCPYARLFEPTATGRGPSGLADWPRPFVFRAIHLDGRTFAAGQPFHFDLNLFDINAPAIAYLVLTFAQVARDGLGASRRKVDLVTVSKLDEQGKAVASIYENGSIKSQNDRPPLTLDLQPTAERVSRLLVKFVTPTQLKSGQQIAPRPEFAVLAARARDRISTLCELYGAGPLPIEFREFGQRASMITMTRCEIENVEIERRSSRTGRIHPIGGFVGEADYEGDLGEFLPYLKAAKWTGVGRQTVWGKGEIEVQADPAPRSSPPL